MKANDQTIRKIEDSGTEWWEIDVVGNCGEVSFPRAVIVLEPKSVNPGIAVTGTAMGLRGLKKAIRLVERERKKIGLTTLK